MNKEIKEEYVPYGQTDIRKLYEMLELQKQQKKWLDDYNKNRRIK